MAEPRSALVVGGGELGYELSCSEPEAHISAMNCVEWVFRAAAAAVSWGECANVNECVTIHSFRNHEFRDERG